MGRDCRSLEEMNERGYDHYTFNRQKMVNIFVGVRHFFQPLGTTGLLGGVRHRFRTVGTAGIRNGA